DRFDAVLGELGLQQRQRQLRADEGDVAPLAEQVRDRADVVLVAVREDDRLDVAEAVPDVVEVGQDQVDAGLLGLGEQHAAVDDEQPAAVLEHGHVAADLPEPAEGDEAQAVVGRRRRVRQVRVRMTHRATSGMVASGTLTPPIVRSSRSRATNSGVASTSGARSGPPPGRPSRFSAALTAMAPCVRVMIAVTAGRIRRWISSARPWSPARYASIISWSSVPTTWPT